MSNARRVAISVRELLGETLDATPGVRVGWPDEDAVVFVRSPTAFVAAFREHLAVFRGHWDGSETLVDADINTFRRCVDIRVKQLARERSLAGDRTGAVEEALAASLGRLDAEVRSGGGKTYYWGGNNYFGTELALRRGQTFRADFPEIDCDDWDEHYRLTLARTSWSRLRGNALRFCNHASRVAEACKAKGVGTVLIPSVGLCAHPWIFADAGLRVVATDISSAALDAVAHPERLPGVYGATAQVRWDIHQTAAYGGVANPHRFPQMAAIEKPEVARSLAHRISFARADWTSLPLENGCADVVFATNALPRDDTELVERVLLEWERVLVPSGHVFLAMHNAYDIPNVVAGFLDGRGWRAVASPAGEAGACGGRSYCAYYSSG